MTSVGKSATFPRDPFWRSRPSDVWTRSAISFSLKSCSLPTFESAKTFLTFLFLELRSFWPDPSFVFFFFSDFFLNFCFNLCLKIIHSLESRSKIDYWFESGQPLSASFTTFLFNHLIIFHRKDNWLEPNQGPLDHLLTAITTAAI